MAPQQTAAIATGRRVCSNITPFLGSADVPPVKIVTISLRLMSTLPVIRSDTNRNTKRRLPNKNTIGTLILSLLKGFKSTSSFTSVAGNIGDFHRFYPRILFGNHLIATPDEKEIL